MGGDHGGRPELRVQDRDWNKFPRTDHPLVHALRMACKLLLDLRVRNNAAASEVSMSASSAELLYPRRTFLEQVGVEARSTPVLI